MVDLLCGDCMSLMDGLEPRSIDMVLCDMPYGVTRNAWDDRLDLDALWEHYDRIVKPNGAIVLFASGMFTCDLMRSNPKAWRYNLIWRKTSPTGFLNAKRMPLRVHEDICVFYRRPPVYNPQMRAGPRKVSHAHHEGQLKKGASYGRCEVVDYDSVERYPVSVLEFATDKSRCALHPTQKPVALCEHLIRMYTNREGAVLDNCMGSGTTGIAAIRCGRDFIGMEKDPDYFRIAQERVESASAQLRLEVFDD